MRALKIVLFSAVALATATPVFAATTPQAKTVTKHHVAKRPVHHVAKKAPVKHAKAKMAHKVVKKG